MAQLICRLPSDGLPSLDEARAAGISAWLVSATLEPGGQLALQAPAAWLHAPERSLPFCLEWQLPQPLSPGQERLAAHQLRPWLNHPHYQQWRGRRPLWLADPERLSQLELASRRLRLQLGPQIALWGGGRLGEQLDGRYQRPQRDLLCRPLNGQQHNYESFLFHAHHRHEPAPRDPRSPDPVIAAVLPLTAEQEHHYGNASAAHYLEWLAQAEAWSSLWHGPSGEAWVLVEHWPGHQRWFSPAREPAVEPAAPMAPGPLLLRQGPSHSWGEADPSGPALLVHSYYLDLLADQLGELLQQLRQAQRPVPGLYVSTPSPQLETTAALLQQQGWPMAQVVGVANRGRDVAPFVGELLPRALAQGHPWIVKLHTKRSSHLQRGETWGRHLQQQLATAPALQRLASWFGEQPQLGLVAPAGTLLPNSVYLMNNAPQLQALLPQLRLQGCWLLQQPFVAGTMFAARTAALARLCQLELPLNAFAPEQNQRDGTLAHALERLMAAVVIEQGLQVRELTGNPQAVPDFGYGWAKPLH